MNAYSLINEKVNCTDDSMITVNILSKNQGLAIVSTIAENTSFTMSTD